MWQTRASPSCRTPDHAHRKRRFPLGSSRGVINVFIPNKAQPSVLFNLPALIEWYISGNYVHYSAIHMRQMPPRHNL